MSSYKRSYNTNENNNKTVKKSKTNNSSKMNIIETITSFESNNNNNNVRRKSNKRINSIKKNIQNNSWKNTTSSNIFNNFMLSPNNLSSPDDIFVFSYNEAAKKYNTPDVEYLLQHISQKMPKILVIQTQESSFATESHFQHIMKQALEADYGKEIFKIDGNQSLSAGLITMAKKNKNVRTRVYVRKNSGIKVAGVSGKTSKGCGFLSMTGKTLYKNSLLVNLNFMYESDPYTQYKFTFVNSHLFYDKKGNTGLTKRQYEFACLINEFGLEDLYRNGSNIIFSGDLNFRMDPYILNKNTNFEYEKKALNRAIETLKRTYKNKESFVVINGERFNKNGFENALMGNLKNAGINPNNVNRYVKEEKYLRNSNQVINKKLLYNELYKTLKTNIFSNMKVAKEFSRSIEKSMKKSGLLTCKFKEVPNKNAKNILKSNTINNNTIKNNILSKFNVLPEANSYYRAPSVCDKILFALQENVKAKDLNVFYESLNSGKSDHAGVGLSLQLKKYNNRLARIN